MSLVYIIIYLYIYINENIQRLKDTGLQRMVLLIELFANVKCFGF